MAADFIYFMSHFYKEPRWKQLLYMVETGLKLTYIICAVFKLDGNYLGMAASALGMVRRKQVHNEFGMNLIFLINLCFY